MAPKTAIGRIVRYINCHGDLRPAMIVFAHTEEIVDLQVFKKTADGSYIAGGVQLGTETGQWQWPPRENKPKRKKRPHPLPMGVEHAEEKTTGHKPKNGGV